MKKCTIFVFVLTVLYVPASFSKNLNLHSSSDDSLQVIEKVYLHVDRDIYYPGDDIWFKAYLIDALDHLLTNHSRSLHVELISPSLKIISSRIISLDGGLGNGDFKVPDDISSGRYRIRAYTNYMRNFSDQLFFTKEITVISGKEQIEASNQVKRVKKSIRLDFFPEGGSLIENVSSIVAFKAVDNLGNGYDVSGKIYSSAGDMITTFKSTHLGMGSFLLTPLLGLSYYSIFRGADSIDFRTEFPTSFPKGVTLGASKNQNNELLITIRTNPETLAILLGHDLLLSISIRKEVINTISFRIKSPVTSFVVPTDYLPEGILMLTLTAREELPLSERLAYLEREAPLKIQIESNKRIYKKREPVTLKISLSGDSIIERGCNVSLAVVDETFINNVSQFSRTISSWFLLESDIRGIVEDPSYYFDPSNTDRLKNLDLLLLTQGWRDFTWKYDTTYFPPEDGFTVSGRLRRLNKNKPVEDSRVSIGIFGGKSTLIKSVPVDSSGRFKLPGIDLTGQATLIATGIGKKDHPEGLLTLDSVTYNPAKVSDNLLDIFTLRETVLDSLKSNYTGYEAIKKKYKLTDTIPIGEVKIIAERKDFQTVKVESSRLKYGTPDAELKVTENYYGFMKVLHLLKGTIPGVVVPPGDTTVLIRGIGSLTSMQRPLVLIDGKPVSFEEFADTPIFLIDRIDVLKSVASTTIYGFQGFNGVINLITKADISKEDLRPDDSSAKIKISGYDASRIFYSPQYLSASASALKSDLRNTLYWNPDIYLEGNKEIILNYYNGDIISRIKIISEGITSTGIPVSGRTEYEVK
jgi:hypothetical protein